MTKEQISYLIQEELSSISDDQERPILRDVVQLLVPYILNIFRSHVNKRNGLTQHIQELLENYRASLHVAGEHLVSIHLFCLVIFDRLEKEAVNCHDLGLQEIWSSVAVKLINISLEVNNG